MKILWLCDKYFDISVDRITWIEGIQYLQKFNHDVTLATGYRYSKQRFELDDSLKYIGTLHFPFLGSCLFAMHLLFWVTRYVVRYKPNIIILDPFAYLDIFPLVFLSRFQIFKTRFILDIRTIPVESYGIKQRINNRLFDFAVRTSNFLVDGMTVITPFMKIILTKKYNLRRFDIGVWTSGASLNKFQPNHIDKNELTKLKYELKLKNNFIIMYHGVITHSRGLFETIEALNILKNTYKNISLLLIGEGAAKKELQKIIEKDRLHKKVILLDPVPHEKIALYIALADVGILPFPHLLWWRVSSPIKLMEYLAMAKPVIVTNIEAHRDVIGYETFGFFTKSSDPADISDGIKRVYKNRNKLKSAGERGRKRIQKNYTWEHQIGQLNTYLLDLAK